MHQSQESFADILRYARKRGHRPTRAQIHRFQQNGLIPKPEQIGLGRGRGTAVRYPAGTGAQLVAACKAIKSGSFRFARWQLWWEGFAIDVEWLKNDLLAHQKEIEKDTGVPRMVRRRLKDREVKELREFDKRVRRGNTPESLDPELERTVARGMGADFLIREFRKPGLPISGFGDLFLSWLRVLSPTNLKAAIKAATTEELQSTREELQAIIAAADSFHRLLKELGHARVGKMLATAMGELTPPLQRSGIVYGLVVRKYPFARHVYETTLAICRQSLSSTPKERANA